MCLYSLFITGVGQLATWWYQVKAGLDQGEVCWEEGRTPAGLFGLNTDKSPPKCHNSPLIVRLQPNLDSGQSKYCPPLSALLKWPHRPRHKSHNTPKKSQCQLWRIHDLCVNTMLLCLECSDEIPDCRINDLCRVLLFGCCVGSLAKPLQHLFLNIIDSILDFSFTPLKIPRLLLNILLLFLIRLHS